MATAEAPTKERLKQIKVRAEFHEALEYCAAEEGISAQELVEYLILKRSRWNGAPHDLLDRMRYHPEMDK